MDLNNYTLSTADHIFNLSCAGYSTFSNEFHIVYDSYVTDLQSQQNAIANTVHPQVPQDLFPLAVRYVSPDKNLYVIERPPFQIAVDFSGSKSYNIRKPVKILEDKLIWVPWTVTVISLGSDYSSLQYYLYFNDGPMTSLDETLVPCFLPNSSHGNICMGNDTSALVNIYRQTNSLTELYNYFLNSYFSGWNCDIYNEIPEYNYLVKDLNIPERIKTQSGLRAYKIFDKPYIHNTKNVYTRMLLLMSHMTLPEINDYISRVKELKKRFNHNTTNFINQYTSSENIIPHHNNFLYRPFYNYVEPFLGRTSSDVHTTHKRNRVSISNYNSDFVSEYISNPYLIYKLYKFHIENPNSLQNANFTFTHSELETYASQGPINVLSS